MDGTLWILLLFCLVYSWLLFNLAALLASRFKRFSLRTLLIVTALVATALAVIVASFGGEEKAEVKTLEDIGFK